MASTLICLSELVPILGADTVVGGKRSKLFTDGRPNSVSNKAISNRILSEPFYLPNKSLSDFHCSEETADLNSSAFVQQISLNERPSPVGGESVENESTTIQLYTNEREEIVIEEDWDDWDNSNRYLDPVKVGGANNIEVEENIVIGSENEYMMNNVLNSSATINKGKPATRTLLLQKAAIEAKKNIVDISELDIKSQKIDYSKKTADEFDFFADMMPVIEKQEVVKVAETNKNEDFVSKLNFVPDESLDENEGWGDSWNE